MVFSNKYRQKNFKVGLTHGVFDLLHIGHVEYFRAAKKICDKLIVSVTTDKFVNKGDNRPAFSIRDRVKMLKSIKYIDEVIVSNYSSAVKVIKASQTTDVGKVIYANSITLTPGTVALGLVNDEIMVHALIQENIESLESGDMDSRVSKLEQSW